MNAPHSHLLHEFATRQSLSPEAALVYEIASWWWCSGAPHPPLPAVLATVALRLATGPVDGFQLGAEGERYTELLAEMIANREESWSRRATSKRVIRRRKN